MSLSFGWKAHEVRESIWKGDDALDLTAASQAVAAWKEDGDAEHLRPYATRGAPTIIKFRTLTTDEAQTVMALHFGADSNVEGYARATLRCFRLGVDFDGAADKFTDARGVECKRIVKERGHQMLADEFVRDIEERYPGITQFYGNLVFTATFSTSAEKKASSPPPTQTPSETPMERPAVGAAA